MQAWNDSLVHEPVTEARFRAVILQDPNYEADGHLVAVREGRVVGFVSAICREGASGRDGKGRPQDAGRGYIRALFGDADTTLSRLLERALAFLHDRGKRHILTGEYTGGYITPGIDARHASLVAFLRDRFDSSSTLDDMEADLTAELPNDYQRQAQERTGAYGVRVEHYAPSMLPAMRGFVADLAIDQWFPDGWEDGYRRQRQAFVALRGDQIVGWTCFGDGETALSLGPMGVAPDHRRQGVGSCLVLACMLEGVRRGYERIWAGWTNTPFYIPSGWRVFRQYVVFEKRLS